MYCQISSSRQLVLLARRTVLFVATKFSISPLTYLGKIALQTTASPVQSKTRPCMCLCMFVCLSVRDHISGTTRPAFIKLFPYVTYGRGSVLLWRRSDKLRISGFVDDVVFAHKLIGCTHDVAVSI